MVASRIRAAACLLSLLLTIGCEADESREGELAPAARYVLPETFKAPSGVALAGDVLYVVGDEKAKVVAVTFFGVEVDRFTVDAPCGDGDGFEAVAYDGTDLLVACEASGELLRVDTENGAIARRIQVADVVDGNDGLEGVLVRPDGHILAAKEQRPTLLVHLDAAGVELDRIELDVAEDVSDIASVGGADCPGQLLALSQEERAVFQLDETGAVLGEWLIAAKRPEGLAFQGASLYVVDEETRELLVFDFTGGCR